MQHLAIASVLGHLPKVIWRFQVVLQLAKHSLSLALRVGALRSFWCSTWSAVRSRRLQTCVSFLLTWSSLPSDQKLERNIIWLTKFELTCSQSSSSLGWCKSNYHFGQYGRLHTVRASQMLWLALSWKCGCSTSSDYYRRSLHALLQSYLQLH